ncbi:S8 family serine peptidase [Phytoactinopolyspora alkaliphila]|nr:S8 family serine peptidase [Phytoactinopolyspora alkaliphila]
MSRLRRGAIGCAVAVLAATTGVTAGAAGDTDVPATAVAPASAALTVGEPTAAEHIGRGLPGETYSVTLLTGDVVHVEQAAEGKQAVTIEPVAGRAVVDFLHLELDGELFVLPYDVLRHVGAGLLDQQLFNVDQLIEQGFHDAETDSLPVILQYGPDSDVALLDEPGALHSAQHELTLESVNARAVAVDKQNAAMFWESVDVGDDGDAVTTLSQDIERIWLDARVEAVLDHSVGQIGAPSAWDLGLDGAGVTVAVLDTGVDEKHPDLAGKVSDARNFTGSDSTDDMIGHGTHVAATIAGTGAASDGLRRGVAPGADLLSGKVLGDDGVGQSSWVIEGMEWAAAAGADVINMSLGGGPTDGTDPMSLAVNQLTEESGALFVIAAGNDGPSSTTVGAPGSADAALTVGAVDRDDLLARFSSRGPRLGDLAGKPDITAPGVGIVAARASETAMGVPVDEHYTAANGTSMATPHVAGAAAILAQRHTEWAAGELKDALISTAVIADDYSTDEQGGGRVDIARAVENGIYASGAVSLGDFADEDDVPTSTEVTYVNTTDEPIELDLDVELRTASGDVPSDAAVRLGHDTVRVEAQSSAVVPVVVDPAQLDRGRYTGRLTATSSAGTVSSTLWLLKSPPIHEVTFSAVGPDGEPSTALPLAVYGDDPRFDLVTDLWRPGQSITRELGEGDYYVFAKIDNEDRVNGETAHVVVIPELEVTGDNEVILDAREAVEVKIETPRPARQDGIFSYYAYRHAGVRGVATGAMEHANVERLYVSPTEQVSGGEFEFNSRWQLRQPMLDGDVVGRPKFDLELNYLNGSDAFDGTETLPFIYVGEGEPENYEGLDVQDALVLAAPLGDPDFDGLTAVAAEAGARMIVFVPPSGYSWFSTWDPDARWLPTMAAYVRPDRGAQLIDLLKRQAAKVRLTGVIDSPYLYDVMQVSSGRVPEKVVHVVDQRNSATLTNRYHDTGGGEWVKEQRFGWREWMGSAINQTQRQMRTPAQREEIVSADGTLWQHRVRHDSPWLTGDAVGGGMTHVPRTYGAGERIDADWHGAIIRPAIPRDVKGLTSYRDDDVMTIRIPEYASSASDHYGFAEGAEEPWGDTVVARLYGNDELIAEDIAAWGEYPVLPEPASYRLDMTVERDEPEWEFSPRTTTSWTFDSARPDSDAELLPLLQVDYDIDTDLRNRAPAGRVVQLGLTARHQTGAAAEAVRELRVQVSFDDGATWEDARVIDRGKGRFQAQVRHPPLRATNGYVSLRVEASDAVGNSIAQIIERAYGLGSG